MNWNKWKSEQYINGQWKAGNSAFCYASVSKHGHPHVVSIKFPSNSPVSNSNFWLVKVSIKIAIVSSRIPLNCWRREFLFLAHIDRNNAVFIIITIAITMCCTWLFYGTLLLETEEMYCVKQWRRGELFIQIGKWFHWSRLRRGSVVVPVWVPSFCSLTRNKLKTMQVRRESAGLRSYDTHCDRLLNSYNTNWNKTDRQTHIL